MRVLLARSIVLAYPLRLRSRVALEDFLVISFDLARGVTRAVSLDRRFNNIPADYGTPIQASSLFFEAPVASLNIRTY